jgi:pyruvate/2-oxoglutarate/acetoin dehydrogenase E1 component
MRPSAIELAATINEELFGNLKSAVRRVGAIQSPVPFSKALEDAFVPGEAAIEAAVRATLK